MGWGGGEKQVVLKETGKASINLPARLQGKQTSSV